MTKKWYRVTVDVTTFGFVEVEAESEEDAYDLAEMGAKAGDMDAMETSVRIYDVEEVK